MKSCAPSKVLEAYARISHEKADGNASSTEIDSCDYLLLHEVIEIGNQGLRLVVEEARASAESVALDVGGTTISDLHFVEQSGKIFEIIWENYIAYCVRNESYCGNIKEEQIAVGKMFCIYSKSYFLDYISRATFATAEYPGPFQHYAVFCENHVIDVVSMQAPQTRRLEKREREATHVNSAVTYRK